MKRIIAFGFSAFIFVCGCSDEKTYTEITSLKELKTLALYKIQNADFLTGQADGVEVKYIVYTDALICVDFEKIKISRREGERNHHVYEVVFPDFTIEGSRVVHDGHTEVYSVKKPLRTSSSRVEQQVLIAAQKSIEAEARKPKHMDRAIEQAKCIVETMIRSTDKEAKFEYPEISRNP